MSGAVEKILFCKLGVPPLVSIEAPQFKAEAQAGFGEMSSKVQPPAAFIASLYQAELYATVSISEPLVFFKVKLSPVLFKEGKFVTSRHIKDRLNLELEKNLALRTADTGSADSTLVFGRGVLHLSVLIETMRREIGRAHV